MHDEPHDRIILVAEARFEHAAAGNAAGKAMFGDFARADLAQQPVAVLRDAPEVARGLMMPEREPRLDRKIFDLVDVVAAYAAGVNLLQRDDIVVADHARDALQ